MKQRIRAGVSFPFSLVLIFGVALPACKTTKQRTEEQSKTQNVLTNYVKTPQDRARNVKARVEAGQDAVGQQGREAAEGE